MRKKFTITGTCIPSMNYMVDISEKLKQIKELIDEQEYFTINRGRQYGKTTILTALETYLEDEYTVISLTFEGLGDESFVDAKTFCQTFLQIVDDALAFVDNTPEEKNAWLNASVVSFIDLSRHLTDMCKGKKIVLMIDEVDKVSNNRVFLSFLSTLRKKFLARRKGRDETFHSVILAGVYDIKNIKLKMINEGLHLPTGTEGQIHNSPWNIAIDFTVDLSFSAREIETMLIDYEKDYQTGMNMTQVAKEIYFYTSGYPVLVSRICKYLDEKLKQWNTAGIKEAVRLLVNETENPLFRGLSQNLEGNATVYELLYDVLVLGLDRHFSTDNPAVDLAYRYGYIENLKERVKISNKIFEVRMMNYFVSKNEGGENRISRRSWFADITRSGRFDMAMCLERFQVHWKELYTEKEGKFLENQCRLIFMSYLKPLLNGVGDYHIESETTDERRMDLVVNYGRDRFIIELKTWKGEVYNQEGVEQLLGYMDNYSEQQGYLLTFDFRKKPQNHVPQWTRHENGEIFEVRVSNKVGKQNQAEH